MNITGASTSTNQITTSTVAASNSTATLIVKTFTGTYVTTVSTPISKRPLSGILYPRYN